MFKEFREFILKGNMLDLAIGVILGAAFGKVVTAFTDVLLGSIAWVFTMGKRTGNDKDLLALPSEQYNWGGIKFGDFFNSLISLVIVGFALFLVVKAYNAARRRFEKPAEPDGPAELPADVKLLAEIRDLLKNKS